MRLNKTYRALFRHIMNFNNPLENHFDENINRKSLLTPSALYHIKANIDFTSLQSGALFKRTTVDIIEGPDRRGSSAGSLLSRCDSFLVARLLAAVNLRINGPPIRHSIIMLHTSHCITAALYSVWHFYK